MKTQKSKTQVSFPLHRKWLQGGERFGSGSTPGEPPPLKSSTSEDCFRPSHGGALRDLINKRRRPGCSVSQGAGLYKLAEEAKSPREIRRDRCNSGFPGNRIRRTLRNPVDAIGSEEVDISKAIPGLEASLSKKSSINDSRTSKRKHSDLRKNE